MTEMSYIKLFKNERNAFAPLNNEERGALIWAILNFGCEGREPTDEELGNARFVWPLFRDQIDRDAQAYANKSRQLSLNATRQKQAKADREEEADKSEQTPTNAADKEQMQANAGKSFQEKEEEKDKEKDKDKDKDEDEDKPAQAGAQGSAGALKAVIGEFTEDASLTTALREFVKMRKNLKSPLTEHALRLLLKDLRRMSGDTALQTEIVNQSVAAGWKGFYELKPRKDANGMDYLPVHDSVQDMIFGIT